MKLGRVFNAATGSVIEKLIMPRPPPPNGQVLPKSYLKIPMPAGVKTPKRLIMQITSSFDFYDKVYADADKSTVFTITGFTIRNTREVLCELSYFHNGDAKTCWIEEARLKKSD